jgi:hypothetical protein
VLVGCTVSYTHEVHTNTIEKWLDRSVLDGTARDYGRELERDGHPPDRRCKLCIGRECIVKENIREMGFC